MEVSAAWVSGRQVSGQAPVIDWPASQSPDDSGPDELCGMLDLMVTDMGVSERHGCA